MSTRENIRLIARSPLDYSHIEPMDKGNVSSHQFRTKFGNSGQRAVVI